ncbi:MAG: sigma-70 family RNA polymerase sigma factor [Acidobacteriales bacterium]|nr:sigma-70 family RNA polymerase sigma factor [Terriglobales bacterium]MCI0421625.1 sigma-70 family RNA polymerase sigma factor [Acidobacteriota bacterium]MCI0620217.1 sigma-70 family RNA polymerase sigma factor [Acidobacteriota bacterium]MCI0722853.1 sigma-70 family RNA polymerase sigma factor [Acidobacteriota bacterium]
MAEPTSDVELMLQVKRGDREAFGLLVQRHRKPLINFIYRFTTNPAESEDLAHEVFIKAFQSAPKYEAKAAFSTWLYRIATNVALNYLRDHKPQLARSLDSGFEEEEGACRPEVRDTVALVEDRLLEREKVLQIRCALAALPENQRLAVVLTKYQELSLKEAAEVLNCSETAVKSLIFRAYSTLRQTLAAVVESRT